ncbi:MAG: PH domain-containing protein, partial [Bacteroidota bacterium]
VARKLLLLGFVPAIIIFSALWFFANIVAWWAVLLPVFVGVLSASTQKKFRLWALHDVAYVKRGQLGEERILLQWQKLQSVVIKQSMFQRKRNLATVYIYTAGGTVVFPFISLEAAHEFCNYALYKTETATQKWM